MYVPLGLLAVLVLLLVTSLSLGVVASTTADRKSLQLMRQLVRLSEDYLNMRLNYELYKKHSVTAPLGVAEPRNSFDEDVERVLQIVSDTAPTLRKVQG